MQITLHVDVELLAKQVKNARYYNEDNELTEGLLQMLCDIEMNLRDNGELTLKASKAKEEPKKCTMDDWTKKHLDIWLDCHCVDDDQRDSLKKKIIAFANEYPDIVKRSSWPEIKDLVERDQWNDKD